MENNNNIINPELSLALSSKPNDVIQNSPVVNFYNPIKNYSTGEIITSDPIKEASKAGLNYINSVIDSKDYLKDTRLSNPDKVKLEPTLRYNDNTLGGYLDNDPRLEFTYGENQGIPKRLLNYSLQFGGNFMSSFLGAFSDVPSAISAVKNGDITKLYNNSMIDALDGISKAAYNNFEVYDTEFTKNHPFLSGKIAGDIFASAGYSLGSIAGSLGEDLLVGLATEGVGGISLGGAQLTRFLLKANKVLTGGEDSINIFKNAVKNGEKIENAIETASKLSKVRDGLFKVNQITNGMFEAAVEAKQTKEELEKELKQNFYNKNGFSAEGKDLEEIQSTVNKASNFTYFSNVALLGITNKIELGDLLLKWKLGKEGYEIAQNGLVKLGVKKGTLDLADDVAEKTVEKGLLGKIKEKANDYADLLIKSSGEMLEEGSQYTIQNVAHDYYKYNYDNKSINKTGDLFKTVLNSIGETATTEEGWINMISGLGGGFISGLVTRASGLEPTKIKNSDKSELIKALNGVSENTVSFKKLFQIKFEQDIKKNSVLGKYQKAVKLNDNKALSDINTYNWVDTALQTNQFDIRLQQIEEAKNLEKQDFEREFNLAYNKDNKEKINNYLDNLKEDDLYIKEQSENINRSFKNPFQSNNTFSDLLASSVNEQAAKQYNRYKKELVFQLLRQKSLKNDYDNIYQKVLDGKSSVDNELLVHFSTNSGLAIDPDSYHESQKNAKDEGLNAVVNHYEKELDFLKSSLEIDKNNPKTKKDIESVSKIIEASRFLIENNDYDQFENRAVLLKEADFYEKNKFKKDNGISNLKARELISYGRELARLKAHSERSYKLFDSLTNPKGFEKFKNLEKKEEINLKKEVKKQENLKNDNTDDTRTYKGSGRTKEKEDRRTSEEIFKELNLNDLNLNSLFEGIKKSKFSTLPEKTLASRLQLLNSDDIEISTIDNPKETPAYILTSKNNTAKTKIVINKALINGNFQAETVILHELVHAYTVGNYNSNKEFKNKIDSLLNIAKKNDSDFEGFYGFTNGKEFIAEAFTNPDFQSYLSTIKYNNVTDNIWKGFLKILKDFLGLKNTSILDEIILVTEIEIQKNYKPYQIKENSSLIEKLNLGYYNSQRMISNKVYTEDELINFGFFKESDIPIIKNNNLKIENSIEFIAEDSKKMYAFSVTSTTKQEKIDTSTNDKNINFEFYSKNKNIIILDSLFVNNSNVKEISEFIDNYLNSYLEETNELNKTIDNIIKELSKNVILSKNPKKVKQLANLIFRSFNEECFNFLKNTPEEKYIPENTINTINLLKTDLNNFEKNLIDIKNNLLSMYRLKTGISKALNQRDSELFNITIESPDFLKYVDNFFAKYKNTIEEVFSGKLNFDQNNGFTPTNLKSSFTNEDLQKINKDFKENKNFYLFSYVYHDLNPKVLNSTVYNLNEILSSTHVNAVNYYLDNNAEKESKKPVVIPGLSKVFNKVFYLSMPNANGEFNGGEVNTLNYSKVVYEVNQTSENKADFTLINHPSVLADVFVANDSLLSPVSDYLNSPSLTEEQNIIVNKKGKLIKINGVWQVKEKLQVSFENKNPKKEPTKVTTITDEKKPVIKDVYYNNIEGFDYKNFYGDIYMFKTTNSKGSDKSNFISNVLSNVFSKNSSSDLSKMITMFGTEFTDGPFKKSFDEQNKHIEILRNPNLSKKEKEESLIYLSKSILNKSTINDKLKTVTPIFSLKDDKSYTIAIKVDGKLHTIGSVNLTKKFAFIDSNGNLKYLSEINDLDEYVKITQNNPETFNDFKLYMNNLKSLEDKLINKKVLNNSDFADLLNINFKPGKYDLVSESDYLNAPSLNELIVSGVSVGNNNEKIPFILSIPEIINFDDDGKSFFQRSSIREITDFSKIDPYSDNYKKLQKFLNDNNDKILALDVRYVAVVEFGDGYELIACRPKTLITAAPEKINDIFNTLKEKSKNSLESDPVTSRYSDSQKRINKEWNSNFQKSFYITNKDYKLSYYLGVSLHGEVSLRIVNLLNRKDKNPIILKISKNEMNKINSMQELIEIFNGLIGKNKSSYLHMVEELKFDSFKNYIDKDENVNVYDLEKSLATSVKNKIREIKASIDFNESFEDLVSPEKTNITEEDYMQQMEEKAFNLFDELGDSQEEMDSKKTEITVETVNEISNALNTKSIEQQLENSKNENIEDILFKFKEKIPKLTDSQLDILIQRHIKTCK